MFFNSENIAKIAEELYEKYSEKPLWKILLTIVLGGILFFVILAVLFSLS